MTNKKSRNTFSNFITQKKILIDLKMNFKFLLKFIFNNKNYTLKNEYISRCSQNLNY